MNLVNRLDRDSQPEPRGRPAAQDVLVGARPLVAPGIELLRTEIRPTGHERLEERGIVDRGPEHLGRERAVEMKQVRARLRVDVDGPVDVVEPRRTGEGTRPS